MQIREHIPFYKCTRTKAELDAVQKVLESGWLTSGEQTKGFEQAFCDLLSIENAVALSSCTAALFLALKLSGIKDGDEVIVPSITFVADANMVTALGARPIFADIESLEKPHISASSIKKCITNKTKAIIVVHYAGYSCDMDEICKLAREHDLKIIEDAAHGPAKNKQGNWIGTMGDFGCFSFYANKNISCGEGGMLVAKDQSALKHADLISCQGVNHSAKERSAGENFSYDVEYAGYNFRFDDIKAALGLEQLEMFESNHQKREEATKLYRELLGGHAQIVVPFNNVEYGSYHIMPILLPEGGLQKKVMDSLYKGGVSTSLHYPPVHKFSAYKVSDSSGLAKSEEYGQRVITLPLYPEISKAQIIQVVNDLLQHC